MKTKGTNTYIKGYKFRIYPKGEQINFFAQQFGCCRFVHNYALEMRQKAYKESGVSLSYFDTTKMLPILKQQEKTKWLGDVMSQPLQMAAKNADDAFSRFFKKQNKYPKFKSRNDRQCFKLPQGFQLKDGLLWLPKMKEGIKINLSREIKGKILYLHISKTTTDKYYVSFTCEVPKDPFQMTGKMAGIDVGIKHAAILSDGTKYENIKALKKLQKKLKYEQRQLSKKQKGSNSRRKQRQKVARLHERIKNLRETHLHKISTDIIKRHDIVITEDLAVENLIKNHCIAKALSDVALGKLITQLKYKSDWHDRAFAQVDRFFPSSKTCFVCGEKNENLKLSDRTWTCNCCHTEHDRDINAARNILKEGLRILSDCVTQPDTKQNGPRRLHCGESMKPEATVTPKRGPER